MAPINTAGKKVSILVPNYKTPEITKLCLRLLRKYTPDDLAEVIVIDNNSADKSLEYLRSLTWIKLIERQTVTGETGPEAHVRALDLGLAAATAPYILSIHTDTFVCRADWLQYLLYKIEAHDDLAGVGSWKLEQKTWWQQWAKNLEAKWQGFFSNKKPDEQYLRSHCALYRRNLLDKHNLCFSEGCSTAGQRIHQKLITAGYRMRFLPEQELLQYMLHLNHATMVLNPELGAANKTISRGLRRIEQTLQSIGADEVLQDNSLDT